MDYLKLIERQPAGREALVEDGVSFSYGDLAGLAGRKAQEWRETGSCREKSVRIIRERQILWQLVSFLACFLTGEIPLILPWDSHCPHISETCFQRPPEGVCMAVATSGTGGEGKIYYRTYESWAGFFPIQNQIFHIDRESRMFAQGSLSFTGNLNLYLALFYAGGTVVAENDFHPGEWVRRMEEQRVDSVYLIPSKLLLFPALLRGENNRVRTVISGSQSMGKPDARKLERIFPAAEIVLYYGATELSYVTYVTGRQMTEKKNLVGRPFPGVDVTVEQGEIYVATPWRAEGIACPCTLKDKGTMDGEGNLYFCGRSDDILLYRGHKVSAVKVENALTEIASVERAAVCLQELGKRREAQIVAYVAVSAADHPGERELIQELRKKLERFELPRRIYFRENFPENASGKVDKKRLCVLK